MSNRQVASRILLLGAAAAFAILIFLAWFVFGKVRELSAVVRDAKIKIEVLEAKERDLALAASVLKNFEEDTAKLQNAFVTEESFVELVKLLERLAEKSRLKFSAEKVQIPAASEEIASIGFKLEGALGDIVNFTKLLEKIPYAGLVENLSIAPRLAERREKSSPDIMEARINYFIFNFSL